MTSSAGGGKWMRKDLRASTANINSGFREHESLVRIPSAESLPTTADLPVTPMRPWMQQQQQQHHQHHQRQQHHQQHHQQQQQQQQESPLSRALAARVQPKLRQLSRLRWLEASAAAGSWPAQAPPVAVLGRRGAGKTSAIAAVSCLRLCQPGGTLCPVRLRLRPSGGGDGDNDNDDDDDEEEEEVGNDGREVSGCVRYGSTAADSVRWQVDSVPDACRALQLAQQKVAADRNRRRTAAATVVDLRLRAPGLPRLLMLDLPPALEAQDREDPVRKLLEQHQNAVLLAVLPLEQELDTRPLQLAAEFDPKLERTIGVLTFADKAPQSQAAEWLQRAERQLQRLSLGFVVLHFPDDGVARLWPQAQQAAEAEFFAGSQTFGQLDASKRGASALAAKVAEGLLHAITASVPDALANIQRRRQRLASQLEELGPAPPPDDSARVATIARMYHDFVRMFEQQVDGSSSSCNFQLERSVRQRTLHHRCRLHWQALAAGVERAAAAVGDNTDELLAAINDFLGDERGRELPNFQSTFPVVEALVCDKVVRPLKQLSLNCLRDVNLEVDNALRQLADTVFALQPKLCHCVKEAAQSLKDRMLSQAKEDLERMFAQESYVWANDSEFVRETKVLQAARQVAVALQLTPADTGGLYSFAARFRSTAVAWTAECCTATSSCDMASFRQHLLSDGGGGAAGEQQLPAAVDDSSWEMDATTERILNSLHAYIRIASTRIADNAALSMMHFMLYRLADELSSDASVYQQDSESLKELLNERDEMQERRLEAQRSLRQLQLVQWELARLVA